MTATESAVQTEINMSKLVVSIHEEKANYQEVKRQEFNALVDLPLVRWSIIASFTASVLKF